MNLKASICQAILFLVAIYLNLFEIQTSQNIYFLDLKLKDSKRLIPTIKKVKILLVFLYSLFQI